MSRRPLVLALALALPASLLAASASAADLMQTYELARAGDPQLAAAESGRLAQKEGAVQARAVLLPQINGQGTYNRSKFRPDGGSWSGTANSRDVGVSVNQSVLDFGSYANLRGQNALSKAADFDLEAANDSLITRTSAAYFNVLVAIETLAAAEAQQTALQKQFDYAQKRLDVGLAPITDVHEARAQYDSARARVILSRNALKDNYEALTEITGVPVRNLKGLPDDFRPELPADSAEGWVETAIGQNPALKSTEFQVQSADERVAAARAGHLPTISLGGSFGRGANWGRSATGGLSSDGDSQSIGVTVNVPIFSGGATQSRVREALANRDAAQDGYEQQKRAIVRNTRNAYQTLEGGISEIEARRLALVSAKAAYDASQVGLEVGTRTVLDVLINQQNLFQAQQAYALTKYNYLQNRLLLDQAAGTLDADDVQAVNRLLTVDAEARLAPDGQ
ncbi:MAG: TolC family outer membrane protein [Pseudoxanthomonas sp.]